MMHSFHPWRTTRFSLREKRLAGMAETPDTNHEQVIQETEKAREHQSIPQTIEDFRKTANQRSAEHQKAAEAAVNKVEVFLNGKIMAEMETYKSFKEYADAPDKNKVFDAHLAKLTQRSAQRFNEGPLGKYLEASSDSEMVTIKLKAAPASAPSSAPAPVAEKQRRDVNFNEAPQTLAANQLVFLRGVPDGARVFVRGDTERGEESDTWEEVSLRVDSSSDASNVRRGMDSGVVQYEKWTVAGPKAFIGIENPANQAPMKIKVEGNNVYVEFEKTVDSTPVSHENIAKKAESSKEYQTLKEDLVKLKQATGSDIPTWKNLVNQTLTKMDLVYEKATRLELSKFKNTDEYKNEGNERKKIDLEYGKRAELGQKLLERFATSSLAQQLNAQLSPLDSSFHLRIKEAPVTPPSAPASAPTSAPAAAPSTAPASPDKPEALTYEKLTPGLKRMIDDTSPDFKAQKLAIFKTLSPAELRLAESAANKYHPLKAKVDAQFKDNPDGEWEYWKTKVYTPEEAAVVLKVASQEEQMYEKAGFSKEKPKNALSDQKLLDATYQKLGPNTRAALDALKKPADRIVGLRALAAMPKEQAKVETFVSIPGNAAKVQSIIDQAGAISRMGNDALLALVSGIKKPTPQDQENAVLLQKFAKTIMHAKNGPISGSENLDERPEPKSERERLQFEIDDCLAIIKDPKKGTLDKIGAAMTVFGNMMTMIMGMATKEGREMLKGPPQKKDEKKKDDKKSEIAGPPKPADAVSRAPSTPATTSRSRENLAQKATEKGKSSLKAYHDDLKTEAAETKNRLESGKTVLATAEASEKNLTDRVAALEKQIIEKGSDERMVIILKGQLASAKGELATATEWVKQGRDEVKKAEAKYKQVSDDLKEVDTFVARTNDTATKLSAAMKLAYQSFGGPDYTLPAYAVALRPFFEGTSLTVDRQTYEVSLIADIPADRPKALQAFRSFAGKAGLPMDEAGTGMDGNGVITNPEAFTNAVQKIAQYLREEHDEKPKRIEKAGKEYVEKIPNVVARSSGGRINYVIKEPNSSPETSLYVIFDTSINQWTWGQPKNGVIDYKQVGFAINPADSDSDKALYTKYNTYITELAKINDDRRAGGASAPSAAPSTPVSAPSAAPSAPASAPAPTVSDTSEPAPTMSSAPASPREDPDAKLDNAVKEARANLEARGMEYMTALGFVRAQEGSPYMKPQNGPIKNYPMVVLTDGWKVFMSSSVGGMTDPSSITPEQALQSFSLSPERKSFMENLVKLNAEYRATVEKAKQERRAQS